MFTRSTRRPSLAMLLSFALVLTGACGQSDSSESSSPSRAQLGVGLSSSTESTRGASSLLERVPETAFFVLRSPDVSRLGEAWQRTELQSLFERPEFAGAFSAIEPKLLEALGEGERDLPGLGKLVELLPSLSGELVIAVAGATDEGEAMPVEMLFLFDAGEQSELLRARLDPLLEKLTSDSERGIQRAKQGWGACGGREECWFDLSAQGSRFAIVVGSRKTVDKRKTLWSAPARKHSFTELTLAKALRESHAGAGEGVLETYVRFGPIWSLVEHDAPPDLRSFVAASGLAKLDGFAFALALGETGLDESILVRSPGCSDLFTHAVTAKPLDAALARWIPADMDQATLMAFDLPTFWEQLRAALPAGALGELDASLDQLASGPKIDVRAQVIGNFGPTFAWGARGSFVDTLSGKTGDACLAIQVRDRARAQGLIQSFLRSSRELGNAREESYAGERFSVLPLGMFGPRGEPREVAWCLTDACLFVASDPALVKRAIRASKSAEKSEHEALAAGLEQADAGTWLISAASAKGNRPASISIGRHTGEGLAIDSREGGGGLCTNAFVVAIPIASAVAIPRLLASRKEADERTAIANERAAIANLRAIFTAQEAAREKCVVDADGDRRAENLLLPELCGSVIPRGAKSKLVPPLLALEFEDRGKGCAQRNGYFYRVDLSVGLGGTSVVPQGNTMPIHVDAAEKSFVAYAWPVESGKTGTTVFAIDERGVVMTSDNKSSRQSYGGLERAPGYEACVPQTAKAPAGPNMWYGRDGGKWMNVPVQRP